MKICQRCSARFVAPDWQCSSCGWAARIDEQNPRLVLMRGTDGAPGFSSDFFEPLAAFEETHFWFTARNALLLWAVRRFFPRARTFLDVGCGTGQVVAALRAGLPQLDFTATDAFLSGLRFASRRVPDVDLLQADATAALFDDEFDVVGAFDVLEHIDDDEAALRTLVRAVKPGGGILITVPQHDFLWSGLDEYSHHRRRYTRARLNAVLERVGVRVVRQTSFVSLLLPALLITRARQRGGTVDAHAELKLSPAVNATAAAMMLAERTLIRAGVSLPAGGSLLTVARRPLAQRGSASPDAA